MQIHVVDLQNKDVVFNASPCLSDSLMIVQSPPLSQDVSEPLCCFQVCVWCGCALRMRVRAGPRHGTVLTRQLLLLLPGQNC